MLTQVAVLDEISNRVEPDWALQEEIGDLIDQLVDLLPPGWSLSKFVQLGSFGQWHVVYLLDDQENLFYSQQTSEGAPTQLELLQNQLELLEDGMNIFKESGLFDYLCGEMFLNDNGKPVVVPMTIKSVVMESVPDGRGSKLSKPIVHFRESDKSLVLNKSNSRAIAGILGSDTDNWIGKRIALTGEHGKWFGKQQTRVVVLDSAPPAKKAKPTPTNGRRRKAVQAAPAPSAPNVNQDTGEIVPDADLPEDLPDSSQAAPEPTEAEIAQMVEQHQDELDAANDLVDSAD